MDRIIAIVANMIFGIEKIVSLIVRIIECVKSKKKGGDKDEIPTKVQEP